MRIYFSILFLFFLPMLSFAQVSSKPTVLILTTGGTIASRTDAPLIQGNELVQAVPQLLDYANIEVEEVVRIGSSKMTPDIWLSILQRINEILQERTDIEAIVITHGTDTMEETAFFLNLTHQHETPIVIVGSMRSTNELSADGPANLLNAVRVGIDPATKGKGVLVVLDENISAARDLVKMNNRRADAFGVTELGYLGFADPDTITYYRTPIRPHTTQSPFNIYDLENLPEVDLLRDYAGFDKSIFDFFIGRPTKGLIISSFAGGRTSDGVLQGLRTLPKQGKLIVISSGIHGGRIFGSNPPNTPIIVANDLPPNKARILLMLALTQTNNPAKIQAIFDKF